MKAETLLATYNNLKTERSSWDHWWETLRHYVLPRRVQPNTPQSSGQVPEDGNFDHIYDTTAIESCQKLASGHISYITPGHEVWFKWSAPYEYEGKDHIESWYNKASEIAIRELAASNFYTEIHEAFLDRAALGTGSLFCGSGQDGRLLFTHIPCGSFVCAENEEGTVDTYYREFKFSPYQAERLFGREKLGERAKAMLDEDSRKHNTSLRFLHVISPREKYDPRKKDPLNKPFRSVYLSLDDNLIVEENGYMEFPYLVTRFLKWGEGPYGLPPGRLVFPSIKQAQFLNRILDTLGEIAAFPRILELANQVGEIDFRAGGRTIISPEAAQLGYPREWATGGNYNIGLDRLKSKQDAIKKAFYIPMFELWGDTTHQMTATEVMARENEKTLMFSPSFTLFVSDFLPTMQRIFKLLYRQGKLPPPPPEILSSDEFSGLKIAEPRIVYQSKIALVLQRLQSESFDRTLQRLAAISPYHPEAADNFEWDRSLRESARIEGVAEQFLTPQEDMDARRAQRATLLQMQQMPPGEANGMVPPSSFSPDDLLSQPLTDESIPELLKLL